MIGRPVYDGGTAGVPAVGGMRASVNGAAGAVNPTADPQGKGRLRSRKKSGGR
jgi:hypothetical protein